ncbi:hypothetical protein B0H10DRAFT_2194446 [Mycena sp. CBHHK59/15]|nr:hypothetical protein B0H10DRAFT_2194446 [Mycena sp. CBHHK59/15]
MSKKVILVTGSNGGIGYEFVHLLAAKGHTVYISSRNESAGKDARPVSSAKIRKEKNLEVKHVQLEVTDIRSVQAAVAKISEDEGHLNVLVDNAGVGEIGKPVDVAGFLRELTAYITSKTVASSCTIALAHGLKAEGIKVNCAAPDFTSTGLNEFREGGKTTKQGAEMLVEWTLLGKDGRTGESLSKIHHCCWECGADHGSNI